MSKLILKAVANLGDEDFEIYWLVGLQKKSQDAWFVRVVLRGMQSHQFHMTLMPIGLLPLLSLGGVFENGELKPGRERGFDASATIADVSRYDLITSADIPPALYSFDGRLGGVQRLFRYDTVHGQILIPAIELIRYLFLHNRVLANALMRPSSLNLLFVPQVPGYQSERFIQFTKQMPQRCLSQRFVKEFAWLALDSDARRAWDSVSRQSMDQAYVSFSPPSVRDSTWRFRGIKQGNCWFVLELLHMTGRRVPCQLLQYRHPRLQRVIRVDRGLGSEDPCSGNQGGKRSGGGRTKAHRKYELDDGEVGSQSDSKLRSIGGALKSLDFENRVQVKAQISEVEREAGAKTPNPQPGGGDFVDKTEIVKVSAGERAGTAKLPPIEFQLLQAASVASMGNLDALDETVRHMRDKLPQVKFLMSLCQLKEGRAFSTVGRENRSAMVVVVLKPSSPPIVLIDVERTGILALSLVALRFRSDAEPLSVMESAAKIVLDGLVDSGGHWSHEAEKQIANVCDCERFPKLLIPREELKTRAKVWALRLIERLGLE